MIDIATGIQAVLRSKRKVFPQHVNRISAMDDPCLRRLYYRRAAWDKASPTPDSLQGVFETGNILEPIIERMVSEVGHASTPPWRIVGSQTPTNDALLKEHQISGSIDGFLQVLQLDTWKTIGVIDIKTMSPNVYPQINSYDDLAKYPWTRGYRGQLMLYALAHNLEQCFILPVNKGNLYDMKLIQFGIDMQYLDGLLAKAKTVNAAIASSQPPDGINDHAVCQRCQWYAYCAPDITTGGNLEIIDNPELESVLSRMAEIKEAVEEYGDLEKARDNMLAKGKDVVCGRFMVTWNEITVNKKAAAASTTTQWRKKIVEMNAT